MIAASGKHVATGGSVAMLMPPAPSSQEIVLLSESRDLLRKRTGG